MLVLARMGLGAAEAGAAPTFTSIAGDIYPKERRGTAMGLLYLSSPLGTVLGFAIGGYVAGHFHWRTAFFVVGSPGILLSLLALATLREPVRERADETAAGERTASASSIAAVVKLLGERKVLRMLLLAGALCIGAQAACSAFMAPFLIRVHGLTVGEAGPLLGLTYGVGGMIGMPLGGILTDRIRRRWPGRELPFFGAVNMLVAMVAIAAFLVPTWQAAIALLAIYAAGAVLYYGVTFSTFLTESPPHLRAGASSTLFLAMNLVGYGLAPQFAGIVSDLAARLELPTPLRFALIASAMLFVFGGLFLMLAGRALNRARAAVAEPALQPAAALPKA
jgi:predicted MFS family arabinose efflux permease